MLTEFVAKSLIAVIIIAVALLFIDILKSKPEPFYGTVIDKHYKAEVNTTGTGYGTTGTGNNGIIITTEHEPEKFLIMVETEGGNIVTVECRPELYYGKQIGEKIDCKAFKGYFTGTTWALYGVK